MPTQVQSRREAIDSVPVRDFDLASMRPIRLRRIGDGRRLTTGLYSLEVDYKYACMCDTLLFSPGQLPGKMWCEGHENEA
jgi:hypothetical protein